MLAGHAESPGPPVHPGRTGIDGIRGIELVTEEENLGVRVTRRSEASWQGTVPDGGGRIGLGSGAFERNIDKWDPIRSVPASRQIESK